MAKVAPVYVTIAMKFYYVLSKQMQVIVYAVNYWIEDKLDMKGQLRTPNSLSPWLRNYLLYAYIWMYIVYIKLTEAVSISSLIKVIVAKHISLFQYLYNYNTD